MAASEETQRRSPNPPLPENNTGNKAGPLTFLSGIASFLLIIYGLIVLSRGDVTSLQVVFGCATIGYALLALGALVCASRTGTRSCVTITQAGAIFYLLIYVLALTLDVHTVFGPSGILLVALALWCNWIAVHKLIRKGSRHRLR